MKIMITGCHGQLGNELQSILSSGKSEIGPAPQAVIGAQVLPVDIDSLDISDMTAVSDYVNENHPDIIINCAAMTNVDGCESDYETAFKVNALGVKNLAVCAQKTGAKLIHVSTDYVFAGNGTKPYCEWDKVDPQSVYGASKALGEKYALSFCERSFVVRTSWLYGYVGKNFVKTVRRVIKVNGGIGVVCDQRGNPTNANDLAHHLLKLAVTEEYGIYHCTGEGECSWYDFAVKIAEYSGLGDTVTPCTTEEYNAKFNVPTKRPSYSSLRNLALECTVGNEMRDWEVALKEYISNLETLNLEG
ncbi:MAG: dTDP-4-dehydrorhamnose reductase [Clostridia bacterium]|nr:dTDP-4-dehydrorhamnose reductase [Clostridia bacterium]